jgi:hypothetical protein
MTPPRASASRPAGSPASPAPTGAASRRWAAWRAARLAGETIAALTAGPAGRRRQGADVHGDRGGDYDDASAAIDWLERVLGFKTRLRIDGDGKDVIHSELALGEGASWSRRPSARS